MDPSPDDLLRAIEQTGYFADPSFDPSVLCSFIEGKMKVGIERALLMLQEGGLVSFQYDPDPALHSRDAPDQWRLVLTELGAAVVKKL
jgi:hypothetical protein